MPFVEGEIRHGTVEDAYQTMALVYRIYLADKLWATLGLIFIGRKVVRFKTIVLI